MGCGNSKNKISVAPAGVVRDNSGVTRTPHEGKTENLENGHLERVKSADKWALKRSDSLFGSRDSLGGGSIRDGERQGSAVSKASKHTTDSGFDDDGAKIVYEGSDPNAVKEVEDGFNTPRNVQSLFVVGQSCPQRMSASNKERMEEQKILASLRDDGLIARPVSRAAGGLTFDIVSDEVGTGQDPFTAKRPPMRLAKLEKRKKKKRALTEEEIQAKLARAEERRKRQEQERLEKIQMVTNKSDIQNAMDSFMQLQVSKEERQKTKEELAAENRENRLKEMRDKLKEKQAHAEEVRKRRKMAPIKADSPPGSAGSRKFRENDSIVSGSQS